MSLGYIGVAIFIGFAAAAVVAATGGGVLAALASYTAAGTLTLLLSLLLSGLQQEGSERSAPVAAETGGGLSRGS